MVAELKQHAATIRKAMVQGTELHAKAGGELLAMNQMVRWINTKEDHCSKIITTVSEYCLCQRVKKEGVFASDAEYVEALKSHHAVLSSAMKAKQTMDTAACDALDTAIGMFWCRLLLSYQRLVVVLRPIFVFSKDIRFPFYLQMIIF